MFGDWWGESPHANLMEVNGSETQGRRRCIRSMTKQSIMRPFEKVQVLDCHENYDFKHHPKHSLLVFAYNKLAEEKGASEAARIMNADRNFARFIKTDITENAALKAKLTETYFNTTKRFFENKGSSLKHNSKEGPRVRFFRPNRMSL